MEDFQLTPEQKAEVQRITDIVLNAARADVERMACVMVSKKDENLLGQSEFEVRDICHRIGAKVVETAVEGRKKGGIKDRA
jgi:hypothetical protein